MGAPLPFSSRVDGTNSHLMFPAAYGPYLMVERKMSL